MRGRWPQVQRIRGGDGCARAPGVGGAAQRVLGGFKRPSDGAAPLAAPEWRGGRARGTRAGTAGGSAASSRRGYDLTVRRRGHRWGADPQLLYSWAVLQRKLWLAIADFERGAMASALDALRAARQDSARASVELQRFSEVLVRRPSWQDERGPGTQLTWRCRNPLEGADSSGRRGTAARCLC